MNSLKISSLVVTLLFLFSCTQKSVQDVKESGENQMKYAENLEIIDKGNNVFIHIKNPETHQIEKRLFVTKNGSKAPIGYNRIDTRIKSVIALSSTYIGMLSKLKESSIVVGVSSHLYVHEPSILVAYKKGKVIEMGEEGSIPVESIVASKAQMIVYSGFGKTFPHEEQLEKLGTICVADYDWRENHSLGKAEWIKFFGYLTGKEKEANEYFEKVEREYNELKILALKATEKPTVFSGNMVGDVWHTPAGESYNALLFKDANCKYVYRNTKGTGSIERSFEQVLEDNRFTDFWLNPGCVTKKELLDFQPKYIHFESVKNNKVYSYSYSGNQFWERSAIEPHHVLSDLIQLFHPELRDKKTLYFYKQLK